MKLLHCGVSAWRVRPVVARGVRQGNGRVMIVVRLKLEVKIASVNRVACPFQHPVSGAETDGRAAAGRKRVNVVKNVCSIPRGAIPVPEVITELKHHPVSTEGDFLKDGRLTVGDDAMSEPAHREGIQILTEYPLTGGWNSSYGAEYHEPSP